MTATCTYPALPPAGLMGLDELLKATTHYEAAIRDHLNGRGPGLTRREREHAHEVGEEVAAWREACRWSYARPS